VLIDIENFIDKLLETHGGDIIEYATPATEDIFNVNDKSKPLSELD